MAAYVKEFLFGTESTGNEGKSAGRDADTDSVVNAMDDILSFGDDTEISDVDGGGSAKTESISDSGSDSDTCISISEKALPTVPVDRVLVKLKLSSSGKYYIRSEAPFGYLDKNCYMGDRKPATNALFEVVHHGNGSGFVSFNAPFFNGSHLAVNTNDNITILKDKERFAGRLSLKNSVGYGKEAQFELFVPTKTESAAAVKKEGSGFRAIVRSVANQRFLVVKSGGGPFACEKDPSLATIFTFEQSKNASNVALPTPGVYHIRVGSQRYLVENGSNIFIENSLRRGLFNLTHNTDDGTISLFSLVRNEYVRTDSTGIYCCAYGEIAKFVLCLPKKTLMNGGVMILVNMKFLEVSGDVIRLHDSEDKASLFEFVPVQK